MDWKIWIGKKIFVVLKESKHTYNGRVVDADDDFISFIDKFGNRINLNTNMILIIKEEERV